MNNCGSLIGHVVEETGMKKAAQELTIEENSWKSIKSIQESMNGLTGESKPFSRRVFLISGKRKFLVSILTTMKRCLRNLER